MNDTDLKLLGRKIQHDPRSLAFPAQTTEGQTKIWPYHGMVLNQNLQSPQGTGLGSCTGNAMAGCLKTEPFFQKGRRILNKEAVRLYSKATELDEWHGTYPPSDTGSSSLGVAKAAQYLGYISSYTHAFGIDHALGASKLSPFIVGTYWYDSMFHPSADGMVAPTGTKVGGHEYLCLGCDPDTGDFAFLNSWGIRWGVKLPEAKLNGGGFWMTQQNFAALLADGGDVLVPVV